MRLYLFLTFILTPNVKLTVCPRSIDQFYIVTNNIKWATTSWTYSRYLENGTRNPIARLGGKLSSSLLLLVLKEEEKNFFPYVSSIMYMDVYIR